MAHFAKVVNGVVEQVIVIDELTLQSGLWGDPLDWIQTSYNTIGGIHYEPGSDHKIPSADQSKALRKNYACIGYIYDPVRGAFIPPKPYASWVLNEQSCLWEAPVTYPTDGNLASPPGTVHYKWDEELINWISQEVDQ